MLAIKILETLNPIKIKSVKLLGLWNPLVHSRYSKPDFDAYYVPISNLV